MIKFPKTTGASLCVALMIATPALANSFKAQNRLTVNPISKSVFEVVESRSLGASGSWCAAADYATRVLGASGKADLYLKTPRGPSVTNPGRKGVAYTLDHNQVGAPLTTSTSVSTKTAGTTFAVGHALALCSQSLIDIGP